MVHRCCVSSCGMSVRVLEAKGLSYHKFPIKEPIRDQWVQAIIPHLDKPESFQIVPRYTRVCSRHFRKKDYCMDSKKRARLNSNAVPSVFPRKCTPLVVPTVLPVSPKASNAKSQTSPDCVPGTSSSSLKSENVHDKTAHHGPPSSSTGFIKSDETLSRLTEFEGHQLEEFLERTELVIESATIQDDHLVLTVMDPSSQCDGQETVSVSNSDDQSQASGNGVPEITSEEATGTKRRKRRKWNRTAFARPAKGKRKSVKSEPASAEDEGEEENASSNAENRMSSSSSTKNIVTSCKEGTISVMHSSDLLSNSLDDPSVVRDETCGTTLTNVTLLFSDLPNQSYHVASVEQELLQSIQAVSLRSGGEAEDGSELQCTSATTTDEAYPYNNLIPAFLHHSSEESLFSNESQNPGGPNEYQFQAVSHSQPEPDLNSTAEDDSLRFELVDLRIDPEIPSAPVPSYLDIDELAHQLNSSLFTDGRIPILNADALNLVGDDLSTHLNIAEELFVDPTEDLSSKLESSTQDDTKSSTSLVQPHVATVSTPSTPGHHSKAESKPPKKPNASRSKAKPGKTKSPPPPPPIKEKKLKGVTKRPKKDKVNGKFSVERFKNSDKDIEYYTGFSTYRNFEAFFRSLEAYIEKLCITDATYGVNNLPNSVDNKSGNCSITQPIGEEGAKQNPGGDPPKKRSCQGRAMSRINELFMTIIRLRRKLPEKVLGHMFFISQPTVSRVVRAWTVLLSKIIDTYPVENAPSSKASYKEHSYTTKGLGIPDAFRELFYSDLAKSIVVTSLNPKKVKSKSSFGSVRNKKSKMSSCAGFPELDSSSHLSDESEDRSGDLDSDYFLGVGVNPNTASPIEQSSLFEFQ